MCTPTIHALVLIGLLFDKSGSMTDKMQKAAEAVTAFFKLPPTEDYLPGRIQRLAPRSCSFHIPDSARLFDRISHTKPFRHDVASRRDRSFAFPDEEGPPHPQGARHHLRWRRSWSRHSLQRSATGCSNRTFSYTRWVIFDPGYLKKHEAETRNGPALLDELARQTGGRNYTVSDVNDLPGISAKIGNDLRNEYLLGYYTEAARDGKYHKVNVSVPDQMPALRTYFRKGYYAQ